MTGGKDLRTLLLLGFLCQERGGLHAHAQAPQLPDAAAPSLGSGGAPRGCCEGRSVGGGASAAAAVSPAAAAAAAVVAAAAAAVTWEPL